jgi:hypothetical protein
VASRLKRFLRGNEEKMWYIEAQEYLDEAKIKLENAKDIIKNEIKTFLAIKQYITNELIIDEYNKLDAIKYRLKNLKQIIEKMEEIISDAEGQR